MPAVRSVRCPRKNHDRSGPLPAHEGQQWHVASLPAPRPPGELAELQHEGPPDECDGADRPDDVED